MQARQIERNGWTPWRAPRRTSDEDASLRRAAHRNERGYTLIEMLSVITIAAVMVGMSVPHLSRSASYPLWNAHVQLVGDIRQARYDALTRGDHFELVVETAQTYTLRRMALVDGEWSAAGEAIKSRTLPTGNSFSQGVGASFEFNTRGLLVTPDAAADLVLVDGSTYQQKTITVWPSGQVAPL